MALVEPPRGVYAGNGQDTWIASEVWIDSAKAGVDDCGPCSTMMAWHVASQGRFKFLNPPASLGVTGSTQRQRALNLAYKIRDLGGSNRDGSTWTYQNARAFRSAEATAAFAELNMAPPKCTAYTVETSGLADFDTTFETELIKPDRWAFVAVWPPDIAADQVALAGQCNLREKHFLLVGNYDGTDFTSLDPLADGRSFSLCDVGSTEPSCYCKKAHASAGAQRMHRLTLKHAAGAATNNSRSHNGKVECYIFRVSATLDEEPTPHFCETTLAAASIGGASNFKVASVTGMYAGDPIQIGPPDTELLTILTVGTAGSGGSGVTTTGGAADAHAVGVRVVSGVFEPDPPPDPGDPAFEGHDPCAESAG